VTCTRAAPYSAWPRSSRSACPSPPHNTSVRAAIMLRRTASWQTGTGLKLSTATVRATLLKRLLTQVLARLCGHGDQHRAPDTQSVRAAAVRGCEQRRKRECAARHLFSATSLLERERCQAFLPSRLTPLPVYSDAYGDDPDERRNVWLSALKRTRGTALIFMRWRERTLRTDTVLKFIARWRWLTWTAPSWC
jgi:hypothetical protein